MTIDSRSDRATPATLDEQIVAEKVMGVCTHRDWAEFKDKRGCRILVCDTCKEEFEFREPGDFGREPSVSPGEFLLRYIPHAAKDEVVASSVAKRLELGGWSPMTSMTQETPSSPRQSLSRPIQS